MAATFGAPASAAKNSSYTVNSDDYWIERNHQLFTIPPPAELIHSWNSGVASVKRRSAEERRALVASSFELGSYHDESTLGAAVGGAEVTDDKGNTDLPPGKYPAEYWKDVSNHGNILATFMVTARHKTGFTPDLSSASLSKEQAKEYMEKFNKWLAVLDEEYSPYVLYVGGDKSTRPNDSTNCDVVLNGVGELVVALAGVAGGPLAAALANKVREIVKSSAKYVTQTGEAVQAGYSLETTATTGERDPIQPICFTSTVMGKAQTGKSVSERSEVNISYHKYKLNSALIIAMADYFAEHATLVGAKQYCEYVNAPLRTYKTLA